MISSVHLTKVVFYFFVSSAISKTDHRSGPKVGSTWSCVLRKHNEAVRQCALVLVVK